MGSKEVETDAQISWAVFSAVPSTSRSPAAQHPLLMGHSTTSLLKFNPGWSEKKNPIDHEAVSYKRGKWVSRYVNPSLI